ncbi:hypothetical protein Tco_0061665 [Tanacetum coccineum]|jgi:hypothetical protein
MLGTGNVVRAKQTNQGNVLGVLDSVQWGEPVGLRDGRGASHKAWPHALIAEASYATTFAFHGHGHGGAADPMVPLYIPYGQTA